MVELNQIINADCMDIMKNIPDKYFELAIVDIPYGINVCSMGYLNEKNTKVKQKNGKFLNANKNKIIYKTKKWDTYIPTEEYYIELQRISKNQIIFGIQYTNWDYNKEQIISWNKGFSKKMSFNTYEYIYI